MKDPEWEALWRTALAATARAYGPYSHYAVGSAVALEGGRVFSAGNLENGSLGLS